MDGKKCIFYKSPRNLLFWKPIIRIKNIFRTNVVAKCRLRNWERMYKEKKKILNFQFLFLNLHYASIAFQNQPIRSLIQNRTRFGIKAKNPFKIHLTFRNWFGCIAAVNIRKSDYMSTFTIAWPLAFPESDVQSVCDVNFRSAGYFLGMNCRCLFASTHQFSLCGTKALSFR